MAKQFRPGSLNSRTLSRYCWFLTDHKQSCPTNFFSTNWVRRSSIILHLPSASIWPKWHLTRIFSRITNKVQQEKCVQSVPILADVTPMSELPTYQSLYPTDNEPPSYLGLTDVTSLKKCIQLFCHCHCKVRNAKERTKSRHISIRWLSGRVHCQYCYWGSAALWTTPARCCPIDDDATGANKLDPINHQSTSIGGKSRDSKRDGDANNGAHCCRRLVWSVPSSVYSTGRHWLHVARDQHQLSNHALQDDVRRDQLQRGSKPTTTTTAAATTFKSSTYKLPYIPRHCMNTDGPPEKLLCCENGYKCVYTTTCCLSQFHSTYAHFWPFQKLLLSRVTVPLIEGMASCQSLYFPGPGLVVDSLDFMSIDGKRRLKPCCSLWHKSVRLVKYGSNVANVQPTVLV